MAARSGRSDGTTGVAPGRKRVKPRAAGVHVRFGPPAAHLALIPRPALLERLATIDEPLVLFCAPAGAGKTMAMLEVGHSRSSSGGLGPP